MYEELDPDLYREAAAMLDPLIPETYFEPATGMCKAIYRATEAREDLTWVDRAGVASAHSVALKEAFIESSRHCYWWTEGFPPSQSSQQERFMALHFMAEMLENPCYP